MAKRLNTSDVLQLLEDDDFGLSEEDDSDFEGEGADPELSHVENSEWRKMKNHWTLKI